MMRHDGPFLCCYYMLDPVRFYLTVTIYFISYSQYFHYVEGDPGPFCLARSGLYLREKDVWIIFLVFKGNDLHSGFAPKEDPDAHQHWVDTTLNDAWNMAGPQN